MKNLPKDGVFSPLPVGTNESVKINRGKKETWINQETGETRDFIVVDRPYSTDTNFHKIWLEDLLKIFNILGGQKILTFNYILNNINPYSNEFGGTVREISEKIKVSAKTVSDVVKTLQGQDFMRKVRSGTYLINSRFLVKGGHNKRIGLMLKYDELNDGRQLEMFDKEEQGQKF